MKLLIRSKAIHNILMTNDLISYDYDSLTHNDLVMAVRPTDCKYTFPLSI